jgi:hypothetical protein
MKKILIAAACLGALPLVAAAQAAPSTALDTGTTATGMAVARKWEIRGGGFMISGERSSALSNTVSTATGSVKGVEVLMRGTGGGIYFRSSESAFGSPPDVINADASVIIGPPGFSIFAGGSRRAITSGAATNLFTFARVGLQMTFMVGATGLRGQVGGWGYVPIPDDKERMDIGGEGEASILYSPPRVPLFIQLGYRNEVFKAKTATTNIPEQVRGLRVGAGIQFGGK